MPAGTTELTVQNPGSLGGEAIVEQDCDQDPGNKYLATPDTRLYLRNSAGGSRTVYFEADKYGVERALLSFSMAPGEIRILRPFPAEFLDHSETEPASNGYVFVRILSGSDGDLKLAPIRG